MIRKDESGYYLESQPEFLNAAGQILRSASVLMQATAAKFILRTQRGKKKVLRYKSRPINSLENTLVEKAWRGKTTFTVGENQKVFAEDGREIGRSTQAYLVSPVMVSTNISFGVLLLENRVSGSPFSQEDISLANAFTRTFARLIYSSIYDEDKGGLVIQFTSNLVTLIENLYLYKKNLENNFLLAEIIKVSKMINSTLDLQSLLESIMDSAKVVLKAESVSLMLIDEKTNELYFNTVAGENERKLKEVRVPMGQGIAGIVAQSRKSLIVNDAQSDPRVYKQVDETTNFVTRNIIASPLMVRNRVIGVIEVINSIGRFEFSEADLELFNSFSEQAALAIHKRELIDSLKEINTELKKKVHELSSLHEVSKTLISTINEKDLFDSIVRIIADELHAEKVSIMLYNDEEKELSVISHYGLNINLLEPVYIPIENTLSGLAYRENRIVYSNHLEDSPFAMYRNNERYHTGACIVHPLSQGDNVYGVINISDKPDGGNFDADDMRLVSTIAGQITKGIQNFRLLDEMMKKQAYEKELEITSSIQRAILPQKVPENSHFEMGVMSMPAKIMGGDFYDYTLHSDTEFTFSIADVSGKSLPAALFMAVSSSIIRTISQENISSSETLYRANDLIYQNSRSGMFVTLFLAQYNADTHELKFASAGHNEQLIYRPDTQTFESLHANGRPLGVIDSEMHGPYGEGKAYLRSGDLLILYTDGVIEAINEKQEEFSLERFQDLIREFHLLAPDQIAKRIFRAVTDYAGREPQFDDFTLLIVKLK